MEELSAKPVEQKGGNLPAYVATDEMCTFLVVNISSLQLIPVNIIAYRSQYGSANPAKNCWIGNYCHNNKYIGGCDMVQD
ncbi:MAG: hypothetical protein ACLUR5_19750 [Eubacterium ventriosum]